MKKIDPGRGVPSIESERVYNNHLKPIFMEDLTPQEAYATLCRALCKVWRLLYIDCYLGPYVRVTPPQLKVLRIDLLTR